MSYYSEETFGLRKIAGGNESPRPLSKAEALRLLSRLPDTETHPVIDGRGRASIQEWVGRDLDVDRAIAAKFAGVMSPEQLDAVHAEVARHDPAYGTAVAQAREALLSEWAPYRDSPDNPGFVADERSSSLIDEHPMTSLRIQNGTQAVEVIVDGEGIMRERVGKHLEGISTHHAAARMGVEVERVEAAFKALSAGIERAIPDYKNAAARFQGAPERGQTLTPLRERIEQARDSTLHAPLSQAPPHQTRSTIEGPEISSFRTHPRGITRKL